MNSPTSQCYLIPGFSWELNYLYPFFKGDSCILPLFIIQMGLLQQTREWKPGWNPAFFNLGYLSLGNNKGLILIFFLFLLPRSLVFFMLMRECNLHTTVFISASPSHPYYRSWIRNLFTSSVQAISITLQTWGRVVGNEGFILE